MRIALASCPTGPVQDWRLGGTGHALLCIGETLRRRGFAVDIVAPLGSEAPRLNVVAVEGSLVTPSLGERYQSELPADSVLGRMWLTLFRRQDDYAAIVNFASDWLPYYLTSMLRTPVLHRVALPPSHLGIADHVRRVHGEYPGRVAFQSRAHARAFAAEGTAPLLRQGIEASLYPFVARPEPGTVAWVGRISPEKGLEDALAIAAAAGKRLLICGAVQDRGYWERVVAAGPGEFLHLGFLATAELARTLGACEALLFTAKWLDAFPRAVLEAMACGTPVVTYDCGGPAEVVEDGVTGFIRPIGDIAGATAALAAVGGLDRAACRRLVTERYTIDALGEDVLAWMAPFLPGMQT